MAVRDPLEPAVHQHPLSDDERLAAAAEILGHRFARPELLAEALTHRSALRGRHRMASNERLEFVGDRVLGLLVAEWLAERFAREDEGALGRRLAQLVSGPVLAAIAARLALPAVLAVAPGEARAGVRKRASVLADAMEAVIGALYLDGGLTVARDFVRAAYAPMMAAQGAPPKDAKTALQEWVQARGLPLPAYRVSGRDGPPHAPEFAITVTIAADPPMAGHGRAGTKQAAEQAAAADLLSRLAP
ncbi:ribonuclease III [Acidibrevibacterium fodinaquatile]|jgi:ribonuclease-3|uniref:ribonuclease III n=1 Tax=Acidibrevibacterium fodinaquatile TaxID=1969806 RepID=UPI000E0D7E7C